MRRLLGSMLLIAAIASVILEKDGTSFIVLIVSAVMIFAEETEERKAKKEIEDSEFSIDNEEDDRIIVTASGHQYEIVYNDDFEIIDVLDGETGLFVGESVAFAIIDKFFSKRSERDKKCQA